MSITNFIRFMIDDFVIDYGTKITDLFTENLGLNQDTRCGFY